MGQSIKLTLRQIDNQNAILILDSAQGQADHQFTLPWLDDQEWNAVFLYLKAFRLYPETWPKGSVKELAANLQLATLDGKPLNLRAQRIGQLLYQAVFGNSQAEQLFQRAFYSNDQTVPPMIELHFPDAGSYLQTYPWELLHDEQDFLFDSLRASLVRYVDFGQPLRPIIPGDQLRLLLLDPRPAMPEAYTALPVLDRPTLTNLLARSNSKLQVQDLGAISPSTSTFAQLVQTLNQFYRQIRLVHIDAHGDYGLLCDACSQLSPHGVKTCQNCGQVFPLEAKAQGYLAFTKADGGIEWLGGQQLAKVLLNRDIQLVVLSVCNSGLVSGGNVFSSIAGALIKQGIPAVVAMQFPVEAESTRAFINSFYQMLLNNVPLTQAMAAARTSLLDIEDTWYRPVLYLRTDPANTEGKIFKVEDSATQTVTVIKASSPPPEPPLIPPIEPQINLAALRRQLNQVFDDVGLDSFCMDNFPEVFDKFSRGMRKDEKINLLLDYCRRLPINHQRLLAILNK